jgi:hypothetical protein
MTVLPARAPAQRQHPEDYPLKPKQTEQFWRIAGHTTRAGYHERPEYRVAYRRMLEPN